MKITKGMIWKLVVGGVFIVVSFSLLPEIGPFLVGLIIGIGFIAWAFFSRSNDKNANGEMDPPVGSWDTWDDSIHQIAGQSDRMSRAVEQDIRVLGVDNKGVYTVLGSTSIRYRVTFNGCTCEDFKKRGLPCKHMYKLAIEHGLFDESKYLDEIHEG